MRLRTSSIDIKFTDLAALFTSACRDWPSWGLHSILGPVPPMGAFDMFNRRQFVSSAAALAAVATATPAWANKPWFFSSSGAVIRGYDVVSFFRDGQPAKGSSAHAVMWKGATWHFSSAENRSRFEMNPMGYAPQYGGYCAFAVARGYTASVVPEAWQIVENKLYLCYSLSVRSRWQRDIPGHIASGDANWPAVLKA